MNFSSIRSQFPQTQLNSTYLDSAATTLKAQRVIDCMNRSLSAQTSNVHRGGHKSGNLATNLYEAAREKVARFINAEKVNEIIFTRGTTESINLIAASLGQSFIEGDEIILSQLEHHSNIVPWQLLSERRGVKIKFIKVSESGVLDFSHFESLLTDRTKVVSLTHLSNALGVHVDVGPFFKKAHQMGALTVLDAAQSVSAQKVDVQNLHCDFLALSGHKLFAPTGVGVLYGKEDLLNKMPPYQGGGSMIDQVSEQGSTYLLSPQRFEAGTPAIAEAICLGEAIDFISELNWTEIQAHDHSLVQKASEAISDLGFRVLSKDQKRSHVVSFVWDQMHPSDIAVILSEMDIAIRAGHHCCQPLMKRLGITGTLRASFSIYSNDNDIDKLIEGLKKAKELLT